MQKQSVFLTILLAISLLYFANPCLAQAQGIPQDLIRKAKEGSGKAAFDLGKFYQNQQNYKDAEKWYKQAFVQNNPKGLLALYHLHTQGHIHLKDAEKSKETALNLIRVAAKNGDANAALDLGTFYFFGRYLDRDHDKAHHWFQIASEKGKRSASYRLGMSYLNGIYNNVNPHKAMIYFEKASSSGDPRATRQIAIAYHIGRGYQKNLDKAIYYYERAAEQGNVAAMRDLANIYHHDRKNNERYRYWAEKAANNGDLNGYYMMGQILEESSPAKAKEYYKKAARRGHYLPLRKTR